MRVSRESLATMEIVSRRIPVLYREFEIGSILELGAFGSLSTGVRD